VILLPATASPSTRTVAPRAGAGAITDAPPGIRFGRGAASIYQTTQRLAFKVLVDGVSLPEEAVRLGDGEATPSMSFTYSYPRGRAKVLSR